MEHVDIKTKVEAVDDVRRKVFISKVEDSDGSVEKVKKKQRICQYSMHSFRHTFVSFCANSGVPLSVVQAIIGHSNPSMTRHYTHIGLDSAKKAINALPQGNQLLDKTSEKTESQKIKEAVALINSKTQLTETDMQLLKILQ